MTDCPEDSDPINFCPYDSTYFEKCKANCPSNYVTCEPPYHGVGEACGGKYASCECTPCSSGYDYTTIPEGYVQDGEACLDCDGKTKYKIKPNPCDGFMDCGSMGPEAGANTCQSGTEIKYDNCKPCPNECSMDSCPSPYTCKKEECSNKYCKNGCQSGYVWNASSQTCTCDPNKYKYTCTGANETGGSGSSCDGKYQSCRCASGYVWKNGQCVCGASFKYTCTGANESPNGTSCGGKYEACSCTNDYQWIDYSCKSGEWKRCNGYRCRVGEIVYSDGTCSSKKVSGKIPIAVVIFSEYYSCNIAMALKPIGSYQWRTVMGFELEEEEQEIIVSQYYDCIYADDTFGDKNEYPAFLAADEYKTEGTEPGDWGLPEAGLMNYISNHISAINNGFNLAGGTPIETNSKYWSASAYSENETWGSSFTGSFSIHHYDKDEFLEVRPVIEF